MGIDDLKESQSPGESAPEVASDIPSIPYLPVSVPGVESNPITNPSVDAFTKTIQAQLDSEPTNPLGQTIITGGTPSVLGTPEVPEKAGFFRQIGHEFWKMNTLAQAGEFVYDQFTNPSQGDIVPDGFTGMNPEFVKGFPQKYWDYITDGKSPADIQARQDHVRSQMEDDAKYEDGSLIATLLGGGAGYVTSPTTYFFPMIAGLKYARLDQQIFQNMAKVAGPAAIDSAFREGLIQANRAGGNLQQAGIDAFADFLFTDALVGAGAAIHNIKDMGNLWKSRKLVNVTHEGFNINPEINDKGEIINPAVVSAAPGFNLSAAQVDAAQLYVNAQMEESGAYAVPWLGDQLKKVDFWSPVLQATNSPYNSVKEFFNRIAPHGIITKGEFSGIAKPDTAFDIASKYHDEGLILSNDIKKLYYKANGITGDSDTFNALKNFQQTVTKNQIISEEDFGIEVRNVATGDGYKSQRAEINEAASLVREYYDKMNTEIHESRGSDEHYLDPINEARYMPLNMNIPAMINRPKEWVDITAQEYLKQDTRINELNAPLIRSKNRIESLSQEIKSLKSTDKTDRRIKDLVNQKRAAEKLLIEQKDQHVINLRNNRQDRNLLEQRVMFTSQEADQLRAIHEPINKAKSAHTKELDAHDFLEQRLKENASQIKTKSRLKNDDAKSLVEELKKEKADIEHELNLTKKRIEKAESEIERVNNELQENIAKGKVDKKFYYQDFAEFKLYDPNIEPKLRDVFESPAHREAAAKNMYDQYRNQSPMDMFNSIFGKGELGSSTTASSLKRRTHLVDTSVYNNAKFLDPDVGKSIVNYAQMVGKHIGFNKAFPEYAQGLGTHGILEHFKMEHAKMHDKIAAEPESKERQKKLNKLDKDFQKSQKLMKDTYSVFMGTYNAGQNKALQRFSHNMKNLVASAKLGSVPIYQISELASIALKNGLMPFMSQALKPMIKAATFTQSAEEKEALKGYAGSAALAMNHISMSSAQLMTSKGSMSYAATGGIWDTVGVATENLAHTSGNLFGINALANLNETLAANTYQSDIMRYMHKFKDGTLTATEKTKLAHIGLQPEVWADRFISSFKEAGGWEEAHGYQSLFYKWNDIEAANRMSMSVRRGVRDTIITNDPFSKPYLMANNPILSMMFMFHGWAYGALSRYTVPLMQRPDAEHMLGVGIIVGLNLATEPILRVANGKDAFDTDEKWYQAAFKAIDYSGLLGPSLSLLQDINKLSGNTLTPSLTSERHKGQPALSGVFGPVYGYLNDFFGVATHAHKGDLTQTDVSRLYRLAPLANALYVRPAINNIIKHSGLPEQRRDTQPWSWYSMIHGENNA